MRLNLTPQTRQRIDSIFWNRISAVTRKKTYVRWMIATAMLAAIALGIHFYLDHIRYQAMHTMPTGLRAFKVTDPLPACGRWKCHMPKTRNPAAYRLYADARKLSRSMMAFELTREQAARILADVSKAAEMGDWGARATMAHFYRNGLGPYEYNHVLDEDEYKYVEILKSAVAAGQPWGFYDIGVVHEYGFGGIPYNREIAWAYYLKAAELGSPEAQMALASAYAEAGRRDAEEAMIQCAFRQGHGAAAYQLALDAELDKRHKDALLLYQEGVKFGSEECASSLRMLFQRGYWMSPYPDEIRALRALGIETDVERSRRYEQISDALEINPDLRFPLIDKALPLPPAELPAWKGIEDGTEPASTAPPTY